jgi:hypothetical protein
MQHFLSKFLGADFLTKNPVPITNLFEEGSVETTDFLITTTLEKV